MACVFYFLFFSERSQGPGFRRFAFKIFSQAQAQPLEVAADSEEKLQDWMAQIQECAEVAENMVSIYYQS